MLVFSKIETLQEHLGSIPKKKSIGFVPTMGALHQGHLSLVEKSKNENDITVVSIFVNPTQFDKQEDLVNYPVTIDQDLSMLKEVYCDVVFAPSAEEIYKKTIESETFDFDGLEFQMEGKFRQGHFNGVGTIVKKLFEIVSPSKAYFGEKDFQQLQIIRKLVEKNSLNITIIGCPIFREKDGLAMSSRNTRLTDEQRAAAPFIYKTLTEVQNLFKTTSISKLKKYVTNAFSQHPLLELEYFEIANEKDLVAYEEINSSEKYRAFIAVYAGQIRLIDNISL